MICLDFLSKILFRVLLKVNKVTIEHQKWPKKDKNSKKILFCPKKDQILIRSPPQELDEGPHSELHLYIQMEHVLSCC